MLLQLTRTSSAFRFRGIAQGSSFVRSTTIRQPVFHFLFPFNTTVNSVTITFVDQNNVTYGPYPTVAFGSPGPSPTDPIPRQSSITYAGDLPTGNYQMTITGTVGGKTRTTKTRFRILTMPAHGTRLNVAYGTRAGVAYGVCAK